MFHLPRAIRESALIGGPPKDTSRVPVRPRWWVKWRRVRRWGTPAPAALPHFRFCIALSISFILICHQRHEESD